MNSCKSITQSLFKSAASKIRSLGVLRGPKKIRPHRLNASCNGAYEGLCSNNCLNNLFNQYLAALRTAKCELHFAPFWLHFGSILAPSCPIFLQSGPKVAPIWFSCCPRWPQEGPRWPKRCQDGLLVVQSSSKWLHDSVLLSKMAPSRPNLVPRWTNLQSPELDSYRRKHYFLCLSKTTQDIPKMVKICPRWLRRGPNAPPDGPRWFQDGPKMPPRQLSCCPRWPQNGPRWLKMVPRWLSCCPRWPRDGPNWPKMVPRWPSCCPR